MKTYFKTILRSFKKNAAKLISLTAIMFLGIAFVSGLGTLSPSIEDSLSAAMNESSVPDIILKCQSADGFTNEQTAAVSRLDCVETAESLSVMDFEDGDLNTRIYIYSSFDTKLSRLVIDGRIPEKPGEILAERHGNETEEYSIGDRVNISGTEYTVTGIVSNPMIFDRLGEPSLTGGGYLDRIFYFSAEFFYADAPVTDIYLRIDGLGDRDYFSDSYYKKLSSGVDMLEAALGGNAAVLTMESNKSVMTARSYCDKVSVITAVFPVFFILVAALVVMTTMTRMIEEERELIGCMKSLGAGNGSIIFKYVFMAAVCGAIAAASGFAVGLTALPAVITPAFDTILFMPPSAGTVHPLMGIVSAAAMIAIVLAVTVAVCRGRLREKPAALLVARAPKPGKRIFLERIGFIWNRLSFKYKSCLRNILRYKKHLVMTVVSVAGAAALTFAGFGLFNMSNAVDGGSFAGFKDSLRPISLVIIAFALLLCVFVIYNLTNMNIGERKREIATLSVLGYRSGEILGYIYREIIIMAAAGAALGVALGCGLLQCVFAYLDFGSIADVEWYSYVASFALVLCFVGITDLILSPKILKIDMTASLKAAE